MINATAQEADLWLKCLPQSLEYDVFGPCFEPVVTFGNDESDFAPARRSDRAPKKRGIAEKLFCGHGR